MTSTMSIALAFAVLALAGPQDERAARALSGVTLDETGRPLAGVEIEARLDWRRLATNQFWRQAPLPEANASTARSDEQGRFEIAVERGPTYELSLRKPGHRVGRAEAVAGRRLAVKLVRGSDEPVFATAPASEPGGVRGLIGGDGLPLGEGVIVRLPWEHAPLATTDRRGYYHVPWSEKAAQDLKVVLAPGYRLAALPKESFARPEPATEDVALERGSVITGRIVGGGGQPLTGLLLVVDTDLRVAANSVYSSVPWTVTTGADGGFRIAELGEGDRFWVRALLADGTPLEIGEGRARREPLDLGTVAAGPTTAVSGTVTGKNGARVDDGRVHVLRLFDHQPVQWLVAHDTPSWPIEPGGRYRIPRLPPGRHELCFWVEGAEHEIRVVEAGAGGGELTLDVEVGKGRSFQGRVVDADGKPIDGALLRAFAWGESELAPLVPPGAPDHRGRFLVGNVRVLTRTDGTFLLERIRSHLPIRLTVEKKGFETATLRVEVDGAPPAEIRLERARFE
jgi:hypothetical protein